MINLHYYDECNKLVKYAVVDWDAVLLVAHDLINAPIDLDHLYYSDGLESGVFNLHTFQRS